MKKTFWLIFFSCFCIEMSSAQFKLSAIFNDNMVLQQNTNVVIRGSGVPGKTVVVKPTWNQKNYTTTVEADSSWRIKIETPKASYRLYEIDFSSGERLKLSNVLIVEVWLCGGQSNMGMPMKGGYNQGVEGSLQAIISSKNPNLRYFGVKNRSSVKEEEALFL